MKKHLDLLFIEDSPSDARLVARHIEKAGYTLRWERVDEAAALNAALAAKTWDAILCDFSMPDFSGAEALTIVRESDSAVPFVFVSGTMGEEVAVNAMRAGADDYVVKNDLARLVPVIEREMRGCELRRQKLKADGILNLRTRALEAAGNGVMITDRDGCIQWVNPAFTRITGYTSKDAVGNTPRLLKSGRHEPAFYQALWATILKGEGWHGELTNRRKDGSLFFGENTITPVRSETGEITHFIGIMTDITVRKQAEMELRQVHAQLQQLLDQSPAVIYSHKVKGTEIIPEVVNQNITRVLGFSVEESASFDWWSAHLHPDDRERVFATVSESLKGESLTCEYRLRHKDGHYVWMEDRRRTLGAPSNPEQIVGILTDITERRRAKEEQERMSARLVMATRAATIGIWDLDLQTNQLVWDETMCALYGISPNEFPGVYEGFQKTLHPEDRDRVEAQVALALEGKKEFDTEFRLLLRDGSIRYIKANAVVLRDASGQAARFIGTNRDITAAKQAEMENTRLARQLELLLSSTEEGIYGIDLDGRCTFLNKAGAAMLGHRPDEALGQNMHSLVHHHRHDGSTYPEEDCPIYKAFRRGDSCRLDTDVFWRKDGTSFPVYYSAQPTRVDGKITGAVAAFSDITARKQMEEQFLRAQRMESIGSLASGIAHDLNNALAPILMGSELLQISNTDKESTHLLNTIHSAAKRAAEMVQQILTFARGNEKDRRAVQLRNLVSEIIGIGRQTFPKSIQIKADVTPGVWTVVANPTQLHQALLNLCITARDAMPDGGTITLGVRNVVVEAGSSLFPRELTPGRYVLLTLTDTGAGMSPEIQARIFEPFFTTKAPGKGTGLGLSTVRKIVEDHGGIIVVESKEGAGSAFKIFLLAEDTTSMPTEAPARRPLPVGNGELILVVDDEAAICSIVTQTLKAFNYKVVAAHDGAQAVGVTARNLSSIRLMITDLLMPIMDGAATIRAVRTFLPALPVIISSGSKTIDDPSFQANSGAQGFLRKPFAADELVRIVHDTLQFKGGA